MKRPLHSGYFTVWTGTTALVVFNAGSLREARQLATSEEFLRTLRRATVVGKPLLAYGAKVWVGLASEDERGAFDRAVATQNPFGGNVDMVWLQSIDAN